MHKSTDEEILATLAQHDSLTVFELSEILNLTKADIRYHIKKLLANGMINTIQPEAGMRGRPALRYKIDNSYFSHNLVNLLNAMFSVIPINEDDISEIAKFYSSLITSEHPQSLITKFNALVIGLNKQNYGARWETQFKGPVIYFSNCPYRQIAQAHPVICDLDRRILEVFLVKKASIIHTNALHGTNNCKFQISI
ncbi:MAG: winged helix-turn-helix transcriptional regulator [Anaerolineaceae bacterium]|nr:winged helix-turn-helix transcriptional regulator [Anaerolineaceae bacterium]